jgi:predicted acyl esterase
MTHPNAPGGLSRSLAAALLLSAAPLAASAQVKGAGTEGRHWVTGPAPSRTSAERFAVTSHEIKITVRDGTVLGARLMLPQNVPGAVRPCILLADGYGHNSRTGAGVEAPLKDLAERGYAGVHLSMRGSGNSGGEADLYNKFGEDGYDVVEWMARQPWCNGKVGMVGASLLGISQWLTAKQAPPSLKAIVPHVACGDCYDVLWYPGGMMPGPGRKARVGAELRAATAHRDFDAFWAQRTALAPAVKAIGAHGIAVMASGGWNDYISPANIRAYEELPSSSPHKLLVGPDGHGIMVQNLLPYSYFEYSAMWMDHFLRGMANGVERDPQATIYVEGANQWRLEDRWPIPDTRRVTLFLADRKSGSTTSLNDGSLQAAAPARGGAAQHIGYDPGSGPFLPTLTSARQGRYKADQRPFEAKVLTWSTAPLEAPTEVTGEARIKLFASVAGKDADFVVLLDDVAPDGTSKQVVVGYRNASHAASEAHPAPPPQGVVRAYDFELLPVSYVFAAGHRIRIAMAGGADVGAGITDPQGPGKSPYPATITIYEDSAHPSSLELPIVGTSWRQLSAAR